MSVQNHQLAGCLLTGNRSNFLYAEGSTAWSNDCPHFLSPLYKADRRFDRRPIYYTDTLMYVDPTTRQTNDYATPIPCDNIPRNIIELDQDASLLLNAERDQLWNRILLSKHSDTTLQLLGKPLSSSFFSSNTPDYPDAHISRTIPYNTLRFGLHDKLLNLTPLLTPSRFADAFITLLGYPCYFLTKCGIYFSTFLFIQALLTLIIIYKTSSIKYILQHDITIFSSIAHGFLNFLTAEMVNDLKVAPSKKEH